MSQYSNFSAENVNLSRLSNENDIQLLSRLDLEQNSNDSRKFFIFHSSNSVPFKSQLNAVGTNNRQNSNFSFFQCLDNYSNNFQSIDLERSNRVKEENMNSNLSNGFFLNFSYEKVNSRSKPKELNKETVVEKIDSKDCFQFSNFQFFQSEKKFHKIREKFTQFKVSRKIILNQNNRKDYLRNLFSSEGNIEKEISNSSSLNLTNEKGKPQKFSPKLDIQCKCKKSQCLKNYCECFLRGQLCNGCKCVDCLNDYKSIDKHHRAKQILYIKSQRNKAKTNEIFCKCSKSHCYKKYCECYSLGKECTDKCKCVECRNREMNEDICSISKKLNEKNYTNQKRERIQKVKNKFIVDRNIKRLLTGINNNQKNASTKDSLPKQESNL